MHERIVKGVCWGIFVCTIKNKRSAIYIAYKIEGLNFRRTAVRIRYLQRLKMKIVALELGAGTFTRDGALDQTVRVSLRRVHFSVCAGVLQTVEPAKVCKGFGQQ
jgi:hypothetical protein